jgi:ubiquinone/menaquinone biosynthesis C-methylase UbiE
MNWHTRYTQQAKWTRNLRAYIFTKIQLDTSSRVLEVGCGTGAILSELPAHLSLHGLDINPVSLAQCQVHASSASLIRGNASQLPYASHSFDVVYCHFLLLWVKEPLHALLEMKRVTKPGGHIVAFAEPDYEQRIDKPDELIPLGKWQTESLKQQGADPGFGAYLAESFFQAGMEIIETGTIQNAGNDPNAEERKKEWDVLEADLEGMAPKEEIQKMKLLDEQAWERGERVLYVPTYFVWGQV